MSQRNKLVMKYIRQITIYILLLNINSAAVSAETPHTFSVAKFSPIPVYYIYPPVKPHGSADDALMSGHIVEGHYAIASPANKPWRIAFLFPHIKDPYWIGCSYGVISEAKRLGVAVDILLSNGYDDISGQLRNMDEAITAKYDAIVISPTSMTGNNASIAKASSQGIPVFELANDSSSDNLKIKVTTSLKGMGKDATEWIIHDAKERGLKSINIALLPGPIDAGWVKGEVDGTKEAARKASIKVNIIDIKYGDSGRVKQSQLATKLLTEHGQNLDYIIGCTGCAPAVISPLKQAGLNSKIKVVAYDLTREIAELIHKGEIVAAVDTKAVSQARVTTNAVVNFLEGRTKELPNTILVKLGLVDSSNYAAYPFDASTAPVDYPPVISYAPKKAK